MADLIINGVDAYRQWGVRMGDNFLDSLGAAVPMKEFIENKSRLEHGKRVITTNPKLDERELTLVFTIEGGSQSDYQDKKTAFYKELYKGEVTLQVGDGSSDVYHLIYKRSVSYGQSIDRTFGNISVKFNEPNPADRE